MNSPATKLTMKGTLETVAMIPNVVRMPRKFVMLMFIESRFTLNVPVYANVIIMNIMTPMVNAIPEALLTRCPAK